MSAWFAAKRVAQRAHNRLANVVDPPRLILTWHRVSSDGRLDPNQLGVDPARFTAQLAVLREAMPVVPLADILTAPGPTAAITFDDGYADNLHHAAPALASAGLPATVFVTAGAIGSDAEFWWDQLIAQVLHEEPLPPTCTVLPGAALPTAGADARLRLYAALGDHCLTRTPTEIAALLHALSAWSGRRSAGGRLPLDRAGLLALAAMPGITIGAHTMNHAFLAAWPASEQERELRDSRALLATLTGRAVDLLAYPYGSPAAVDATTVALAKQCGYHLAVTTDPGQVHRWSDPLRLRRHTVRDWDTATFAARLRNFLIASDHGEDA